MPETEMAGLRPEIPNSEILDHASPHVINSAQLAAFEKSFAFGAGLMRQYDEDLKSGLISQEMEEVLQQARLQPFRPSPDAPVLRTLKDVDNYIHSFQCAAYLVNKEHKVQFSNQAARNFAGADRDAPHKSVAELNELVAKEYLSFPSFSRLPAKDFLALERMLGPLAKTGYDLPDVTLKLARKHYGQIQYLGVTIDAKHLFSAKGEFLGTRCLLIPSNPPLVADGDEEGHQRDDILFPLPETLLEWVQARLQLQQKALQLRQEAVRVNLPVEPEGQLMTDSPPFRTKDDLKKLLNFDAFKKAVESLGKSEEDKELMRVADDFITGDLRGVLQPKIKIALWNEDFPGTVSFTKYLRNKNLGYIKAVAGKHTAQIRPLTPPELAEFKEQLAKRKATHQERLAESLPTSSENQGRQ